MILTSQKKTNKININVDTTAILNSFFDSKSIIFSPIKFQVFEKYHDNNLTYRFEMHHKQEFL